MKIAISFLVRTVCKRAIVLDKLLEVAVQPIPRGIGMRTTDPSREIGAADPKGQLELLTTAELLTTS